MTRFQHLGAVPNITEYFLIPVLKCLLTSFPSVIKALQADNGSEYIDHRVATFLTMLHSAVCTKSMANKSHQNALVERVLFNAMR